MRSKAYAYVLGVVAIFAGLAVAVFSSSRLVDLFGGAVVLGGLGVTGWVAAGRTFLRLYIGALLIMVLIGAVVFLTDLMSRIDASARPPSHIADGSQPASSSSSSAWAAALLPDRHRPLLPRRDLPNPVAPQ